MYVVTVNESNKIGAYIKTNTRKFVRLQALARRLATCDTKAVYAVTNYDFEVIGDAVENGKLLLGAN